MKRKVCPRCKCGYEGYPTLSRVDNKTYVCPECGGVVYRLLTVSEFVAKIYGKNALKGRYKLLKES